MSSYLTVPTPVKKVFDAFPLKVYPPVEQLTPEEKQAIEARLYSFSYDTDLTDDNAPHFKLGVYNVFVLKDHTILATDPLCLAAELAISIKNSIKLPKLHNEKSLKKNSLFVLSHNSNSRGFLPLFIEEGNKSHHKIVKDYISIDEINLSRVQSSSELILIKLIDVVFYDYWITSLLFDISEPKQSEIYQGYTLNEKLQSYGAHNVISSLTRRNGFNIRNPNIAALYHDDSYSILNKYLPKVKRGIEFEKSRNYKEFKGALENLESILEKKGTKFMSGDVKPELLDLKLASYVILGQKFLEDVSFGQLLSEHSALIDHSNHVVQFCS